MLLLRSCGIAHPCLVIIAASLVRSYYGKHNSDKQRVPHTEGERRDRARTTIDIYQSPREMIDRWTASALGRDVFAASSPSYDPQDAAPIA